MSKTELLHALTEQRDALLLLCDGLTEQQRTAPRTPEGWSVQDFTGHLSFWDQYTLNCIRDTLKNGRPAPLPAAAPEDDINGRAVAQRKHHSWQRIRAEFQNTRNALIRRIDALSETDLQFYVPSPWVNDARMLSLETLVREEVTSHTEEHLEEFRQWLGQRK